jgi:hypothetical protein
MAAAVKMATTATLAAMQLTSAFANGSMSWSSSAVGIAASPVTAAGLGSNPAHAKTGTEYLNHEQ